MVIDNAHSELAIIADEIQVNQKEVVQYKSAIAVDPIWKRPFCAYALMTSFMLLVYVQAVDGAVVQSSAAQVSV